MTLRTRQKPSRARSGGDRDRRTFLTNIGFALIVVVALLLLAIDGGLSYYDGHLAAAIKVNDQSLSRDALVKQMTVDAALADISRAHIRTLLSEGHLWSTDATARMTALDTQGSTLDSVAAGELIDGTIQLQLASQQGVAVTDADVDAQITKLATTPELRHVWMIAVTPTLATGETSPTTAEKTAAKNKALGIATQLKAGGDWATIAKNNSTDATKDQGGDVGYIDANSSLDAVFTAAMMTAIPNTTSDLIEGLDGGYRIGKVTDIIPASTDATFLDQVKAAGISTDDLRLTARYQAATAKLTALIVNPALAVGPQRHVSEIFMAASASETGPSAIRVRHILFSPNHDPNNASKVVATDPAWAAAKALADAAYAKLQADPTQFDAMARAQSDESAARTSGGKLPYFSTSDGVDAAFAAAIFKAGLQPGQLLAPIQSAFGWHVIQIMHGPTDLAWATKLATQATSLAAFGTLARDNSDLASAPDGGDAGWIGKGQLSQALTDAIFAAPLGKVSQPVQIASSGTYLFWVTEEVQRAPDALQTAMIKASTFSTWYTAQKGAFTTWQDPAIGAGS